MTMKMKMIIIISNINDYFNDNDSNDNYYY